jgi:hypothetical protein
MNRESNKDARFLCLFTTVIMFVCYTVVLYNSGSIAIATRLLSHQRHQQEMNVMRESGNQLLRSYFMC